MLICKREHLVIIIAGSLNGVNKKKIVTNNLQVMI